MMALENCTNGQETAADGTAQVRSHGSLKWWQVSNFIGIFLAIPKADRKLFPKRHRDANSKLRAEQAQNGPHG
jgi:hypothetical protein